MSYLGSVHWSACKQYRYRLERHIPRATGITKRALFIMLNPSTADEFANDPTIARCMRFADREGCSDLTIVNLFALRATDPSELKKHIYPVGPRNQEFVLEAIEEHEGELIVVAWGANPMAAPFNREFKGLGFYCLGKNKNGSPKHPLYIKSDKKLELF